MEKTLEDKMNTLIGYCAYDVFDEFYEHHENGCYVAGSRDSLLNYLVEKSKRPEKYRWEKIHLCDLSIDFVEADGIYWLDSEAMDRFRQCIDGTGVKWEMGRRIEENGETQGLFNVKIAGQIFPKENDESSEGSDLESYSKILTNVKRHIKGYKKEKKKVAELMKEKSHLLLRNFEYAYLKYPRNEVEVAMISRDYVAPYLLDVLRKTLDDPDKCMDDEKHFTRAYAAVLLGHFKEKRAHEFIVDLFGLPGRTPEALFGNHVFRNLAVILLRTCGGSLDSIRSLVENREACIAARSSAMEAMVYSAVEGFIDRDEVLPYFGAMFTGGEADRLSGFWDELAWRILYLCPVELNETIKRAYTDELITPEAISLDDFEMAFQDGRENCMGALANKLEEASLDDPHARILEWPCYNKGKKQGAHPE